MPDLDRIVSYSRMETTLVTPNAAPDESRNYNLIGDTAANRGIGAGRVSPWSSGSRISTGADLPTADVVYLSTIDTDGNPTPDDHDWPPSHIIIEASGSSDRIRYHVASARHPTYRDAFNRLVAADDTWEFMVDKIQEIGDVASIAFGGPVTVTFRHVVGDPQEVVGTVHYRLWARRRDPSPRDEIAQVADFSTVPVTSAVWRFRAEQPYPTHEMTFTDDQGEVWEVFGIRESDARGRFVDALCSAVVGPSS